MHSKKIKEHAHVVKMDEKRLKVALAVLDAVKGKFPETKKFDECQKEKISAEEVILFTILKGKS